MVAASTDEFIPAPRFVAVSYFASSPTQPRKRTHKFMSINSNTNASRPVGLSYSTSSSCTTLGCGDSLRNAWISLKLFTCSWNGVDTR